MKYRILFLLLGLFSLEYKSQAYLNNIMLQSFGWDENLQTRTSSEGGLYEFYNSRAGVLKAAGFDMIWFPPPSKSSGGVGYIPTEWNNFSLTSWGTQAQLTKMLTSMNAKGVNPIADVVVNHRGGDTSWTDFVNPTWDCSTICITDEATAAYDSNQYPHTPNPPNCRPSGAADTGDDFNGARDLDHTNPIVQNGVKAYLTTLQNLGFKGWRWDMAKGFGSSYLGSYINYSQPYFSVGEYWEQTNMSALEGWVNGTYAAGANVSTAFDFPLRVALYAAFQMGDFTSFGAPGLSRQTGYSNKAVTFVDNHDTFSLTTGSNVMTIDGNNILQSYAIILTHPGIPCVFAPHYYGGTYSKDGVTRTFSSYATAINALMAVRKANGLTANSTVTVDQAAWGLYTAYIKANSTDASPSVAVCVTGGSTVPTWTPSSTYGSWILNTSGNGYAVWSKVSTNVAPSISISPVSGTYISGTPQTVTITASDDSGITPTIRYTTDGTDPTSSSPIYTSALSISNTTVVKAIAIDNQGLSSGVFERDLSFATPSTIVIRFYPPTTWTAPDIHYWSILPTGTADAVWSTPVSMVADTAHPGWFEYTFPNALSVNFLFRSGLPNASATGVLGTNKTADITNVTQSSWYVWNANSSDYVSLSLDTQEVKSNTASLLISPNPVVNGMVQIKYSNATNGTVYIYDVSGRLLKTRKLTGSSGEETLDVTDLKTGLYLVQLKSDTGSSTEKMLVK